MEIIIIIILIILQSIFGIGLLLFGTPTFILFGYSFAETLSLLLPISILISLIQIFFSKKKNMNFFKNFNLFFFSSFVFLIFFFFNFFFEIIIYFFF